MAVSTPAHDGLDDTGIFQDMGLSWHARRILRRLQDTIQAQGGGQNGFDQLRAQLYDLRVASGKRLAAEPDFRAAVVGSGLLSSEEAVVLFRGMLASSRVDQVDGKLLPLAEVRSEISIVVLYDTVL